jgi:hypothetical protein
MAKPKPEVPRTLISLRVTPQFLRLMDACRGSESRAAWLEGLALMAAYKAAAKPAQAARDALPTAPRSEARPTRS